MARYIDADALKTAILTKYRANWEIPCSYEDRLIQRVVTDLRVLIEQSITADVVPKSEIEELKRDRYQLLPDGRIELLPRTDIYKIKTEVAREFINTCDSVLELVCKMAGLNDVVIIGKYAELKKKYTEGEGK